MGDKQCAARTGLSNLCADDVRSYLWVLDRDHKLGHAAKVADHVGDYAGHAVERRPRKDAKLNGLNTLSRRERRTKQQQQTTTTQKKKKKKKKKKKAVRPRLGFRAAPAPVGGWTSSRPARSACFSTARSATRSSKSREPIATRQPRPRPIADRPRCLPRSDLPCRQIR